MTNKQTGLRKEIKHMRGMADALNMLAGEVEQMGGFDKESEELFRKIGSSILFQAVAIGWKFDVKGKEENGKR